MQKRLGFSVARNRFAFAICLLAVGAANSLDARQETTGNWPNWRGHNGDGVAAADAKPPMKWSETENVRWKTPIPGKGLGTPVVWQGKLYLMTAISVDGDQANQQPPKEPTAQEKQPNREGQPARDGDGQGGRGRGGAGRGGRGGPPPAKHAFAVICVDAESGKIDWQKVVCEEIPHEGHHQTNSFASGSAVTDGQHIFAYFGSFGVYCLTMEGEVVWSKDFGSMQTRNGFGEGSSPSLHGSTLVVPWDHEGQSMLYALDAKTGEIRWQKEREEQTTWATPLITEFEGRTQVITNGMTRIRSYDLETGELIWECGGMGPNPIPTPVRIDDMVICMTGYRGFAIAAIPLSAQGDITDSNQVIWKRNDSAPYVPSPLLYDSHLYITKSRDPVLSILDPRTGKTIMEEQRLPEMDTLYASPIAADGRIYISSRNGITAVLKHGSTLEILASNKIDDGLDASPVAVGTRLYLRGLKNLYCIE